MEEPNHNPYSAPKGDPESNSTDFRWRVIPTALLTFFGVFGLIGGVAFVTLETIGYPFSSANVDAIGGWKIVKSSCFPASGMVLLAAAFASWKRRPFLALIGFILASILCQIGVAGR